MSWYQTVGQGYSPQQTTAKDNTWDNVTKALSVINPTLGAVSSVGQLVSGYYGGKEQRKAQIQARDDQQAFQERMANTAHVRQIADMRNAGLNPILSAKYGGANTPSGSTFKPENKALQYAHITQALANAQASVSNARNLGYVADKTRNEVMMQNMDLNMMAKRGLSPMAFKHTWMNQLGSEFLKTDNLVGQFVRGELLTNALNSSTAKSFFSKIKKLGSAQKAIIRGKANSNKTLRIRMPFKGRVPTN